MGGGGGIRACGCRIDKPVQGHAGGSFSSQYSAFTSHSSKSASHHASFQYLKTVNGVKHTNCVSVEES